MQIKKVKVNFTLIELLVIIAILAILMSMLQPALLNAIAQARNVKCLNNLKSLSAGTLIYADDNNEFHPNIGGDRFYWHLWSQGKPIWDTRKRLRPYFGGICGPEFVCSFYEGGGLGDPNEGIENMSTPNGAHQRNGSISYWYFPTIYGRVTDTLTLDTKIYIKDNQLKTATVPSTVIESDIMYGDIIRTRYSNTDNAINKPYHFYPNSKIFIINGREKVFQIKANYSYSDGSAINVSFDFPIIKEHRSKLGGYGHPNPSQVPETNFSAKSGVFHPNNR